MSEIVEVTIVTKHNAHDLYEQVFAGIPTATKTLRAIEEYGLDETAGNAHSCCCCQGLVPPGAALGAIVVIDRPKSTRLLVGEVCARCALGTEDFEELQQMVLRSLDASGEVLPDKLN